MMSWFDQGAEERKEGGSRSSGSYYGLIGDTSNNNNNIEMSGTKQEEIPAMPRLYRSGSSLRTADEYDKSASYICDALDGVIRKQPLSNGTSTLAFHVHLAICLIIKELLVPGLVLMTFFERPWWCKGEECECAWDPDEPEACPYPTFDVRYLSETARFWLEASILGVALVHQILLRVALGAEGYWMDDGHVFVAVAGAIAANVLYATAWFRELLGDFVVLPYFRLLVFVAYSDDVRSQLRLVGRILPHFLRVGALIALQMITFAWAGCVLFPNTPGPASEYSEGDVYFNNFRDAMWNIFILITTSNNPDVWGPAYAHNRWTCLVFIAYLLIGFFFLTNLLLATVYNVYTEEEGKLEEAQAKAKQQNLQKAFEVLAGSAKEYIDTITIRGVFVELNQHREVTYIDDERSELLLEALDHATESRIDFKDFQHLCDVLQLEMKRTPSVRGVRRKLRDLVASKKFEYAIDVLLTLNAVAIAVQTRDQLFGRNPAESTPTSVVWEYVETGFAAIYVVEMLAKLYALGPRDYFHLKSNLFDFVVTVSSIATISIVYSPNAYDDPKFVKLVLMIRLLRLLRLLVHVPEFQTIGESFFNMLPAAMRLIKLLFCVMYVSSLIGMALYGGKINMDPDRLEYADLVGTDYYDSLYVTFNFNDMWSAFVLLFCILVVNNWWVLADGFIAVGGLSARWYFLVFYLVGVLVCINISVAFILDTFITEYEKTKKEAQDDKPKPKKNTVTIEHPSIGSV